MSDLDLRKTTPATVWIKGRQGHNAGPACLARPALGSRRQGSVQNGRKVELVERFCQGPVIISSHPCKTQCCYK